TVTPLSDTALGVTVIAPVFEPVVLGVKLTRNVQLWPGVMVTAAKVCDTLLKPEQAEPAVSETNWKSADPLVEIELRCRSAWLLPGFAAVFVTVNWLVAVVPLRTLPKTPLPVML